MLEDTRQEWQLPFQPRMINDREPGHEGPSCGKCAAYQARQIANAENCPMLKSSRGGEYRSPHASTYLFEARFSRWQCTQGVHGSLVTLY